MTPFRPQRWTPVDSLVTLVAAVCVFLLAWRIQAGLQYHWNWAGLWPYLFRFDADRGLWWPSVLLQGFFLTIRLSLWAMVLAMLLGLFMGLLRQSRHLSLRWLAGLYVEGVRNLPPLVLVFIVYFFIGDQILTALRVEETVRAASPGLQAWIGSFLAPPSRLGVFLAGLLMLALYEGAYITEMVRAGIASIERGQWEAADALGLSPFQRLRTVILPQAVRRILPPLAGQFISTIKDSAIVSVISIPELTFQGMELMSSTYLTFEIWITVTALYFLLTYACSRGARMLEMRLQAPG